MVYTTSILALPLVLLVWAVDMYLLLLLARGVLSRLSNERTAQLCLYLKPFTDAPPQAVKRWLERQTAKPIKQWIPWAVVAFGGLIIRQFLIAMIVSLG